MPRDVTGEPTVTSDPRRRGGGDDMSAAPEGRRAGGAGEKGPIGVETEG